MADIITFSALPLGPAAPAEPVVWLVIEP